MSASCAAVGERGCTGSDSICSFLNGAFPVCIGVPTVAICHHEKSDIPREINITFYLCNTFIAGMTDANQKDTWDFQ